MSEMLYVKESDLAVTKTRKAFLKAFIMNGGYDTYSDKECTQLQCAKKSENGNNHAYRSVTEIHSILKGRFKLTTLKATIRIIFEITKEEENIAMVWCKIINKCVIKYVKNTPATYISSYSRENHYTTKGVDGYSLKDFDALYKSL